MAGEVDAKHLGGFPLVPGGAEVHGDEGVEPGVVLVERGGEDDGAVVDCGGQPAQDFEAFFEVVDVVDGFADGDFFGPVDGGEPGEEAEFGFVTGDGGGFYPLVPGDVDVDGVEVGAPALGADLGSEVGGVGVESRFGCLGVRRAVGHARSTSAAGLR